MTPLEQSADVVIEAAKRLAPGAVSEAYLVHSRSRSSEWSEGKPENQALSEVTGVGLRMIREGRLGFSFTNALDADSVDGLVRRAIDGSSSTAPDPMLDIPASAGDLPTVNLDLVDPTLDPAGWDERVRFLETLESEVKSRDPRITKVYRGSYREGRAEVVVANSRGVRRRSEGTSVSFGIACVVMQDGETQIGYGGQMFRHRAQINPTWVIDRAVEDSLSLLGGKRIPSGRYDLVLSPSIAGEILELLAGALRADQVQKGKSFLASRVGSAIASPAFTLIDDGRLPRGVASSPFDAEGVPTQRRALIDKGVLKGFLFDTTTAKKANQTSTGNAGRASYKGVPEPEASNFFLDAGTLSPEAILKDVKSGIYVRHVMGLHTVDTISGDFSLGLMGERIENGQRTHAVRGVTMAGNLLDLLQRVEAVGSDVIFSGSVGTPTLRIREISVGGEG
jgi:PmbA protein